MKNRWKILTRLELTNLFGMNVLLHTKEKKEKKRKLLLTGICGIVVLLAAGYIGGQSYGLIFLGMPELVPVYLIFFASVMIGIFGIMKAGYVIFCKNGYEFISSLPVSQMDIVLSRYLRMYVEGLLLTCIVMLPGIVVYGVFVKPSAWFYVLGISGLFAVPLLPLSVAVFFGAVILGISSRMKHKSLAEAALSVLLVVGITGASSKLGSFDGELDLEKLKGLSGTLYSLFGKIYPPSLWLGTAMAESDFLRWLLFVGVSVLFAVLAVVIVAFNYHAICLKLFGSFAKHDYRMREQEQNSVRRTLCARELKRYFSSGVYVANTILGPVAGVLLSGAFFVMGESVLTKNIPFAIDVCGAVPLLLAAALCMMNMTCVSVSMEGKNWWILKSLPLDAKVILEAKAMVGIILLFPFYAVSEIFLLLALRPGFWDALWILAVPMLCILFTSVFGLTVNLCFPVMKWESEVRVVKQSTASVLGGLGGAVVLLIFTAAVAFVPKTYSLPVKIAVLLVLCAATAALYVKNNHTDLQKIE